ncbi:hypothetical protein [Desulfocurvus sp.]|jgi:hypothetical protein|uniref:hypothetical protein n=1 Tax=Desulfocurvus sp. TaxID=2871698 RepID=UPI0025BE4FB2|nr:hypothetical protein [Desulfocurvus sp.]MCK9239535.1 hypothetical protein [Desulfocurvus sp.]
MKVQGNVIIRRMLQCEKCGEIFSKDFNRCPKCRSTRFSGYTVVNPVARLPIESILRVMAHLMWMFGTAACLFLLWQTDSPDTDRNLLLMLAGFAALGASVIVSVALFGMSEMMYRIVRIQLRLRAFFEDQQKQDK